VNFNWNDCNWEFEISIYLKSGYLSFAFGERLEKGACNWKCESYLLDCAQKISTPFGSNYFTLHFRSSIDRPLNLPQYPCSNNYFSISEENI
jgi:hypothetical protein